MFEMTGIRILTLGITHHFQIPGSKIMAVVTVIKMIVIKMAQMEAIYLIG